MKRCSFFPLIFPSKWKAESCDVLTLPEYVHVASLAHETYGSEVFFISREDYLSLTLSAWFQFSNSFDQYRLAPDHFRLLMNLGPSASFSSNDVSWA
jgi:hypothetical protein